MSEFFSMGGYGGFIWPAYLISALLLGGLAQFVLRRAARARRRLAALSASRRDGEVNASTSTD